MSVRTEPKPEEGYELWLLLIHAEMDKHIKQIQNFKVPIWFIIDG